MKTALASFFLILLIASEVNAQSLQWVRQIGDTLGEYGKAIAIDPVGNVYTIGNFSGTVDFDPGSGTFPLTSTGLQDISISKLDASGNFLWAKSVGGLRDDYAGSIAVDAAGNVYYSAMFTDTIDANPGTSVYKLTARLFQDNFISKLDASGNFLWAKSLGGGHLDGISSICLNNTGELYMAGYFEKTLDFDLGPGVFNLSSKGQSDIFILKLDQSGNFIWAKSMGSISLRDYPFSITTDNAGNVLTTGIYGGIADFDPGPNVFELTSQGFDDVFISKLDDSGSFIWARSLGGIDKDYSFSITTDDYGSVYTTGTFKGAADFDPSPRTQLLTATGQSRDIFLSKLDAAGNYAWAKRIGGNQDVFVRSVDVDRNGDIYTTGSFSSSVDFDPGPSTYNLTSSGLTDIFISKLDNNGFFLSASKVGGANSDYVASAVSDSKGNLIMTGGFYDVSDFDPDTSTFSLTSVGLSDMFILKMQVSKNVGNPHMEDLKKFRVYPNPSKSNLTLDLGDTYENIDITIRNVLGEIVSKKSFGNMERIQLILPSTNGLYFIEAIADNRKEVWKVIKN